MEVRGGGAITTSGTRVAAVDPVARVDDRMWPEPARDTRDRDAAWIRRRPGNGRRRCGGEPGARPG